MSRTALVAGSAAAAAALAATGVLLVAGSSASASPATHTLKLTATSLQAVDPTKSTVVETDKLRHAGKKVGYENQSCDIGGHGIKCSVSFALSGGLLIADTSSKITLANHGTFKGKITGGTGIYTGAKGKIKGRVDGHNGDLTFTYTD